MQSSSTEHASAPAAQRGAIRDRNGIELATSVGAVSLALDPKIARAPERVAALLEQLGRARAEEIRARIAAAQDRNFVWLVRGLPLPVAAAFDTLGEPGLIRIREHRREYVHDWMAAALVGTTDVDGRGIAGIELAYDSLLQGSVGERIMERIGRGRLRPTLGDGREQHARPGCTIELTLDWDVQQIAETELARSVSATGAAAGIVLVLRPQTGEIIACAQQPAFTHSRKSDAEGLRLRAVTDMYEPGSTFKAIVAAAALAEHRASPDQLFDGHGGVFRLPDGRAITDHTPLGTCTLADALAHSSNIVFAQLAERAWCSDALSLCTGFWHWNSHRRWTPWRSTRRPQATAGASWERSALPWLWLWSGVHATPASMCIWGNCQWWSPHAAICRAAYHFA